MLRWRQLGVAAGLAAAILFSLTAVSQFLAPSLTYEIKEGIAESLSGNRGRTTASPSASRTGSYYRSGILLNRYLKEKAGMSSSWLRRQVAENIGALLDPARDIHLAMTESSADDGAACQRACGPRCRWPAVLFRDRAQRKAPCETCAISPARSIPALREPGHAPTLGEKVLEYYGLVAKPK